MRMRRFGLVAAGLLIAGFLVYQIPWVRIRVDWQLDKTATYLRGFVHPVEPLPAPQMSVAQTELPAPTLPPPTATPQASPTPLPPAARLASPDYELQGPNNCGPATLAMYLRFYGWAGDQHDISDEIKPIAGDKNVNVDELIHYARNNAGWLQSIFRVGGTIERIKALLSVGIPVMIEEGEYLTPQEAAHANDDLWAGHYILITAYDDAAQTFTYQDTWKGPDLTRPYAEVDEFWQQFNRVYILLYTPDQEPLVREILGADWDEDANRQNALLAAQAETGSDPQNAYAWFNLGMNQVYFEDYGAAANSFDQARLIGLPQRMLRYQFGPFFAYFNTGRMDDMEELVDYALQITDASEEALIWRGWVLYRQGDTNGAITQFRLAQTANPGSVYADQALTSIGVQP
jgi:hypothetical protein